MSALYSHRILQGGGGGGGEGFFPPLSLFFLFFWKERRSHRQIRFDLSFLFFSLDILRFPA